MNMKRFIVFFMSVLCIAVCKANDGVYFVSGNQLMPLVETDISVSKEVLTISICDDGFADVDVYYEFTNKGKAKTVLMGFEANAPYNAGSGLTEDRKHPYINDFTVTMNGSKLGYANDVCAENTKDGAPLDLSKWKMSDEVDALYNAESDSTVGYSYVYKFEAPFREGKNIVHHTYRYQMSYGIATTFHVMYKLSPALRWANHAIDDFTLRIQAKNTAKHFFFESGIFESAPFRVTEGMGKIRKRHEYNYDTEKFDKPLLEVSLRNGEIEWHSDHFTPDEELVINSADELIAYHRDIDGQINSDYEQHFTLGEFYDRSNGYEIERGMMYIEGGKPGIDTRILRNLPYAHRGYVFKDKDLQDYFSQFFWYMPDSTWKASTADFTYKELEFLQREDSEVKHEGKVVVNEKTGAVEGRWLRTNTDTYTVSVQDYVEVPQKGNKIVTYRAVDGQGVVYTDKDKVNVRENPSTSSRIVGTIHNEYGDLPECFPCLGLKNGWYLININGKRGYVRADLMTWDSICTM